MSEERFVSVGARARRAAGLVRELFNVVREVNAWRRDHDAFVAAQLDEMRSTRRGHRALPPRGAGSARS